jgi:hypothetical protein
MPMFSRCIAAHRRDDAEHFGKAIGDGHDG